jgi:hypothetical protein
MPDGDGRTTDGWHDWQSATGERVMRGGPDDANASGEEQFDSLANG